MAWEPGMKQVEAVCGRCGGPGITTEAEFAANGGRMVHADPAICGSVFRNTGRSLFGRAVAVFGSREEADRWLGSPQPGLGGAVPLVHAGSAAGLREVEDLLGRIEHGVYT